MKITTTEHGLTITTERGDVFHGDNDLGYLQLASSAFLGSILRDEVDVKALAARMLANRGHDEDGRWIGFAAAERRFLGAHHTTAHNAQGSSRPRTFRTYRSDGLAVNVTIPED